VSLENRTTSVSYAEGIDRAPQLVVLEEGGSLRPPESLLKTYPYLDFLEQQRLWKQAQQAVTKRRREFVLVDLGAGEAFRFNPFNWQAVKNKLRLCLVPSTKLMGAVVIADKRREGVEETLRELVFSLSPQAAVFIFEKKDGENTAKPKRQQRKDFLKELGLAEAAILVRPSAKMDHPVNQFLVWRARMPKEWKPREAINLLAGPGWKVKWIEGLVRKAANEYRKMGFIPLNAYEMGNRLRNSRFPPDDISRAKLGFGFELQAPCGCRWRIDINGCWTRVGECVDRDCDGIPYSLRR
jgi:hypothetical protein